MANPNDITAKYYEIANQFLKNETVLSQEFELIKDQISTAPPVILDIGCGTGRHLIPLAQEGYQVSGIDSSSGMLEQLRSKMPEAEVNCADIFQQTLPETHYDLVLMFWNTFNEIALSASDAARLLELCAKALKPNGRIIINIDDASRIKPQELDFNFEIMGEPSIKYFWKVKSFDKATNTTHSREEIVLPGQTLSTTITQRWWSRAEVEKLAAAAGLSCETKHIPCNTELYLILQPNGKRDQ